MQDNVSGARHPGSSPPASSPAKHSDAAPAPKKRKLSLEAGPPKQDSSVDSASDIGDKHGDANDSESDLSVLADEPAIASRKGKKSGKSAKVSSKDAKGGNAGSGPVRKSKTTPAQDLTPDEADVKRLQSELLKCGVRKFWANELKPYPTPKAKVAHLKSMLKDIGMTGRFSMEKAKAIKERRELEADVDALTRGQQGTEDEASDSSSREDGKDESPPMAEKRRKVQARFVDFGDSDEET